MAASTSPRVLRMAGSYYRKDGVSEEAFHAFCAGDHAIKAAKIHERYGILSYQVAFSTASTRAVTASLGLPWKIDDHDLIIEYYFRSIADLLAISGDADFKALHVDAMDFITIDNTTVSLTWVETYLKDGRLTNVGEDGKSMYQSFAELSALDMSDKFASKYY
ncbi:Dimeric alpha+beta barrel [Glarea lozoyensis ATCC 20868]|uniref:Dimeric alpha+beta barrel n=1 Tax=Glarea lozoyensis (strain ATCC 20868 / MF5171) TaxID=1116229 RepID=S3DP07_GLAL2|nr:Dimeric alpha+beta barrel [Glarea lozoyensis ATCC 20868]EPE33801.1 Dimeric alpha+beta barrel [Glarea lozoyensis ATCC 20868]